MAAFRERDAVFEAIQKVVDDEKAIGQELCGPGSLSCLLLKDTRDRTSESATFDCDLTTTINTSLISVGKVHPQLTRERAFCKFHQLRMPDIWRKLSHELEIPPVNTPQQQAVKFQLLKKLLVDAFASQQLLVPCL